MFKRGGPTKADLLLVDHAGGTALVKDFRHKRSWVRLIGRIQIRRECAAYQWLGPIAGVPQWLGRVDAHAFALARVEAVPVGALTVADPRGTVVFDRLQAIVRTLHAKGLVHWDLRTRDNVLLGDDDRVWVIDFASAIWLRPGGWVHRIAFGWMSAVDESALLKWKRVLDAGPYSEHEAAFLRRFEFWRALWPFNPKRRKTG